MIGMGYTREEIQESLSKMKYDDITATYLLLGRKVNEVKFKKRKFSIHSVDISTEIGA